MRTVDKLLMRIKMLFRRDRAGAQLQDELQFHLERQIEENLTAGMNSADARRAALRSFGNPTALRDQTRETWSWQWLELLFRDLRYAARTLTRSPGFSIIAIAVMALCIGAATSLFTIVRSVLLRPLPFRDPGQLIMVYEHFRSPANNRGGFNYNVASPGDYFDWRTQTHGFQDIAAWRWSGFNLTGEHDELPEIVNAAAGTWNLFPLLGVPPAFGRTFTEAEDHPGATAVMLGWSIFQRRFAGNPAVVGTQIHLDGKPYSVVGVLPEWFKYPDATVDLWVPYATGWRPEELGYHDHHGTRVIARLRPGVSLANAIGQIEAVQYRLHMQYAPAPVAEDVAPREITDDLARDVKHPLLMLMGTVGCLLLIGCLNVANLLVARGAARQKEVAIRSALGAQRFALIREQMAESLLICLAGGVTGVLLSLAGTRWLATAWKELPSTETIHVDATVVAFAFGLVCIAALLAGLLPALSTTGKAVFAALQASSRTAGGNLSRTALRKTLLIVEIAVTVVLLIAAGLLLKTFVRLRATDPGFVTGNVLTMGYSLPAAKYDKPEKVNAFNETLLQRLRAMPGVRAVALGTVLPGAGYGSNDIFYSVEHPPTRPGADLPDALNRTVDAEYFSALQIPLLSGRFFTAHDREAQANKVIVSRDLVKEYFPDGNPIGQHIRVPAYGPGDYEIVGVVGDILWQVGQPSKAMMYFPTLSGQNDDSLTLAVRTDSDPLAFSVAVQKQLAALDPGLPASHVKTLQETIEQSLGNASLTATLVLAFAVLSLVLASVGLYGVLSYLMTQRMTELGIRIALGAQRSQVLRLVLLDGLRPAFIGLGLGLIVSALVTRVIASLLYATQPLDPLVFATVATTLAAVATLACIMPAMRASRLDPMTALRME
jgi:predicted permease